jgi:cysteine desulfurase
VKLKTVIYLDYNATTPIDPRVAEVMMPLLGPVYGNPSSSHSPGREAKAVVERARGEVAGLLGCAAEEVVFTGGGTESNNHAIRGVVKASGKRPAHVITSAVEHPAVTEVCGLLAATSGCTVTVLPVNGTGLVDTGDLERAIRPETVLVTVMHANNEVGTIQPIAELAAMARAHGIPFHTDAAQSVGKVGTWVGELGVDLLSVAGHKLYAPKGVGALYVRKGTSLVNLMHGAGHEAGRRPGTENLIGIAGLGAACRLAAAELDHRAGHCRQLRDRLWEELRSRVPGIVLNGHPDQRLPNTLSVAFPGADARDLLARLPGLAASPGSACHSGETEPSAVLAAMGVDRELALGTVRFSTGRETTGDDIHRAAEQVATALDTAL